MDLNSGKYGDKNLITKKLLYDHITDLDIYNMYMDGGTVSLNGTIKSPLKHEKRASFGFFLGDNNEILFKDFRLGGGDCVKFVQLKYSLNYNEALIKIAKDFSLDDYFIISDKTVITSKRQVVQNKYDLLKDVVKLQLKKRTRKWENYDLKFWGDFGITEKTLLKYNVVAIDYFFMNDHILKADKYAYCFIEHKDGYETYKIYQPFNDKYKWINNHNDSVWQGWSQLPETGDSLLLTKSLKDVMSLHENFNIPAVSMQAESIKPKITVLNELKKRFDTIYLFYDNDYDKEVNWGQKYAKVLSNEYDLDNVFIPSNYKVKDYSDSIKKYGVKITNNILIKEITKVLPF